MMRRPLADFAKLLKRFAACRSGATTLEMGIVLPVLVLMIVGTIYAGWLIYSVNVLFYAVEEAARCVAVNAAACQAGKSGTPSQVTQTQKFAVAMSMGLNVAAANFSVTQPANGCGWQVSYNYTFAFAMPFKTNFNVTLPASACYPAQP
jgi:Flp pilus assembly protein TadG